MAKRPRVTEGEKLRSWLRFEAEAFGWNAGIELARLVEAACKRAVREDRKKRGGVETAAKSLVREFQKPVRARAGRRKGRA